MEAIPLTWDASASVLVAALCLHSLVVIFPRQSTMRGPLLAYTLFSEIVGGCAGGKPPTEWVSPDNLPAGTYKAVEKNGTICPDLPGLTDFEMVVTDGEEGQLVNLTAIAEGERLTMKNATPVKWYAYKTVYSLSRFGSETIEGTPKCFHVEPSIDVAPFVKGLYRTLRQNQKQKTGLWFGSQLIFCYTNLGLMVGIGAEKTGTRWHATRYAFRIHFPGLPTYDYICKASPSITSRRFISNRDSLRRHLRAQGKAPKRSHREVVLEPSSEPILSANPNGENPRLALDFVKSDSLPAGTYKAVEKNGTICPELPGLTDFEMVVTDGEEGQLVNLTAIAEGERLTMENATPVKWYAYKTVYSLSRFGSETIEGTPKCFHVEPSIFVALFVEGLYRTLQQNQEQKTGLNFGSQLIFCYTNLGLMVGIGAEKMGWRWHATRYAFRIHFPGLHTYDYICKASPSITSHKKTKQKREYVQQELLPHRESREWYSHESTFEPQPKIGRLELAKISAAATSEEGTDGLHGKRTSTVPLVDHSYAMELDEVSPEARNAAASEEGTDGLHGKRTSTVTLVDHSYAMELDEVSPEARNPPPARVFEDDLGKRLSPVGDDIPARATSGFEHTKRTLDTSGGRGRRTSRKNRNPQHLLPLADMGKYLAIAAPNAEQMSKHE